MVEGRKRLVILGSTGSIGRQALEVARSLRYPVIGLAACSNIDILEQQIRAFSPPFAAVFDEKAAADLRTRVADRPVKILGGMEGLCALCALPETDLLLNAIVGMVGLQPTLTAIEAGHDIALANKETLVAGGELVMTSARRKGVQILPVDSEHAAIFQCLQGTAAGAWAPPTPLLETASVRRLILTASGGPFFGKTREELERVTVEDALCHPNWSMGGKITVDCATMMNKGLELIEACHLFGLDPAQIDVVVHRESVVHSLVEFSDRSVLAQMSLPDMRLPIQYALTWPMRASADWPALDLVRLGTLSFFAPDDEAFPCLRYCRRALEKGGLTPAAVNAANEEANALFRAGRIGFMDIPRSVERILEEQWPAAAGLADILEVDEECRARVRSYYY